MAPTLDSKRLALQAVFETLLGTRNVYFQPPPSFKMKYPCIVYNLDIALVRFADDRPYSRTKRYQVTVIDANPDSSFPDKIAELPMSTFDRHFTADQLHHFVFQLFF